MSLSHSARAQFSSCQRSFMFSYKLRLERNLKSGGRRMGSAFAKSLELGDGNAASGIYDALMDRAGSTEEHDQLLLERTQVRVLATEYLAHYFDQNRNVRREVQFDDAILGRGALDGVRLVGPSPGSPGIRRIAHDDKLLLKNFWREVDERKLSIDNQVTAYFAAMQRAGTPLDEFEYRVTFKPTITWRRVRQPETLDEYAERLTEKILDAPADTFRCYQLYRSQDQIDEMLLEAAEITRQERAAARKGVWPKNTGSCTAFGGCDFLPLCSQEIGADELYRIKLPRPKPLVLTALQEMCALALQDAFFPEVDAPTLAKQVGHDTRGVIHALRALERRGLVSRVGDCWQLTEAASALRPTAR